jgi:hypothetical protein
MSDGLVNNVVIVLVWCSHLHGTHQNTRQKIVVVHAHVSYNEYMTWMEPRKNKLGMILMLSIGFIIIYGWMCDKTNNCMHGYKAPKCYYNRHT